MAMVTNTGTWSGKFAARFVPFLAFFAPSIVAANASAAGDLATVSISAPATANEAANISVTWTVVNNGDTTVSGTWADKLLLSADAIVGDDRLLANVSVTATLAPGQSYSRTESISLPQGSVGLQRVIVQADTANFIAESNEANNTLVDPAGTTIAALYPDMMVTLIDGPTIANSGELVTVTFALQNQGTASYSGGQYYDIFTSTDGTAGNADDRAQLSVYISDSFAPGQSRTYSPSFRIASWTQGTVRWQVRADRNSNVNEGPAGEGNNIFTDPDLVTVALADYTAAVQPLVAAYPGAPTNVQYSFTNNGPGTIVPLADSITWLHFRQTFYLSTDDVLDGSDRAITSMGNEYDLYYSGTIGLQPGETVAKSFNWTIPGDVAVGTYRLIVRTDDYDQCCGGPDAVQEASGTDNEVFVSAPFEIAAINPDLVITAISAPTTANSGEPVTVSFTVQNQGGAPIVQAHQYHIYSSVDGVAGNADDRSQYGNVYVNETIPPGESRTYNATFRIASWTQNSVRWQVRGDVNNAIPESASGEGNNIVTDADAVNVALADYVAAIEPLVSAYPGGPTTVNYSFTNNGPGSVSPLADYITWIHFRQSFYLSTDDVLDASDRFITATGNEYDLYYSGTPGLQPGETVAKSFGWTIPGDVPVGTYRLILRTDDYDQCCGGDDAVVEASGTDNEVFVSAPFAIAALNPDLVVTDISSSSTANSGESVTVSFTVQNQGGVSVTQGHQYQIYSSVDGVVGNGDDRAQTGNISVSDTFAPGQSRTYNKTFLISSWTQESIRWQVRADIYNNVPEGSAGEANNVTIDDASVAIGLADLTASVQPLVSAYPGAPTTVNYAFSNNGPGTVVPLADYITWIHFRQTFYLSTDDVLDASDVYITATGNENDLYYSGAAGLQPGETIGRSFGWTIPANTPLGTYRILVRTDDYDQCCGGPDAVYEAPGTDAEVFASESFAIAAIYPNLIVTDISAPAASISGEGVTVSYTVQNTGASPLNQAWYDQLIASTDGILGNADDFEVQCPQYRSANLPIGASANFSFTLGIPSWVPGVVRWGVRLDTSNNITEGVAGDADNGLLDNVVSTVVPANIEVTVAEPGLVTPNTYLPIRYTYKNIGIGTVRPVSDNCYWRTVAAHVYLSTDGVLDASDALVYNYSADESSLFYSGPQYGLQPNESVTREFNVWVPGNIAPGAYRVIVRVDGYDNVNGGQDAIWEAPGTDNEIFVSPDPFAGDLIADAIVVPASIQVGQTINVSWTVRNGGINALGGQWFDEVLLSDDATVGNDISLGSFARSGPLAGGASYTENRSIVVPASAGTGTYFFLVRADAGNAVEEPNEINNVKRSDTTSTSTGADLVVLNAIAPSSVTLGSPFNVSWTTRNNGTALVTTWIDGIFLSNDATLDSSDQLVGSRPNASSLAPSTEYSTSLDVTLPLSSPSGAKYLFIVADATNALLELNDSNNASSAIASNVSEPPLPDLVASALTHPIAGSVFEPGVVFSWTTANTGEIPASAGWVERVRLLNASNAIVAELGAVTQPAGAFAAGATVARSITTTLPNLTGTYTVVVDVDADSAIGEASGESNNRLVGGSITIDASDLVAQSATFPSAVPANEAFQISWTALNQGAGASHGAWFARVYLSADASIGTGDMELGTVYRAESIAAAGTASLVGNFTVPASTATGAYRVLILTDAGNSVPESNESNNVFDAGEVTVTPQLFANLVVTGVAVAPSATLGGQFEVSWTVQNIGNRDTIGGYYDRIWLSTDSTFGGDADVGTHGEGGVLAVGASRTITRNVHVPATVGNYFVFLQSDIYGSVAEGAGEGDNVSLAGGPVSVGAPNLVVTGVVVAPSATLGGQFQVAWTVQNIGNRDTLGGYYDRIWLSTDGTFGGDADVGTHGEGGALAAGATRTITRNVNAPATAGTYSVFIQSDVYGGIAEGAFEGDNISAAAGPVAVGNADLIASAVTAPEVVSAGSPIAV
ncbi:MAG: CARDB domain-containing protein [bacterium]